jgi:protein BCP1
VIKGLVAYLQHKAASNPAFAPLLELLSKPTPAPIGLILTERVINSPAEIVPPMYSMLLEEIGWALEVKEPYHFSHYLILSRTYEEVPSKLDVEVVWKVDEEVASKPDQEDPPLTKKEGKRPAGQGHYFHPEDEAFGQHALCHGSFAYTHQQPEGHWDSKRAFQEMGVGPQGHLILMEAAKFEDAVKDIASESTRSLWLD